MDIFAWGCGSMEFPFRRLLYHRNHYEPLDWWKNLFGRSFPAVRSFLSACEDRMALQFPSPDDPSIPLTVQEAGLKYRAVPPPEFEGVVEELILDWEDVQVYRLDHTRLRAALRKRFNLKAAPDRSSGDLLYIGRCEFNGEARHVFLCLAFSAKDAHKAIEACADPAKYGCILFATRQEDSVELLKKRGISSVSLRECISITKKGFVGDCPVSCTACVLPAGSQVEARIDNIEKKVLPDAERGAKTKQSASAGGKARSARYAPYYRKAKKLLAEYHSKNPDVSYTQAVKRIARHLPISESSIKKHVKKRDFPGWED